ncbi:MAG: FkbM family methyltransferase [Candidatus Kapaibacterium sp.]
MIKVVKRYITEKFLKKRGYQLRPFPEYSQDEIRRIKMMKYYNIDTLIDVGANSGQYGSFVRTLGYDKKIVSFEPLNDAFSLLQEVSKDDINWFVNNYALGNENTKSLIHISGNSYSSSILDMLDTHLNAAPESAYISTQEIEIKTFNSVYSQFCTDKNNIMLKIDTQGYEKNVLDGVGDFLKHISILDLEMSLVPLYENGILFMEMFDYVGSKGFKLFSLENEFSDETSGQLLQVNGIFINNSRIQNLK